MNNPPIAGPEPGRDSAAGWTWGSVELIETYSESDIEGILDQKYFDALGNLPGALAARGFTSLSAATSCGKMDGAPMISNLLCGAFLHPGEFDQLPEAA